MEESGIMSFILRRFNPDTDILKPFDCGDSNLNDFLLETAGKRQNAYCHDKELLSVTYVIEDAGNHSIVAYFSQLHFSRIISAMILLYLVQLILKQEPY